MADKEPQEVQELREELRSLAASVGALTELVSALTPAQTEAQASATATAPTPERVNLAGQTVTSEPIAGNLAKDQKIADEAAQLDFDTRAVQAYTFEKHGRRDYRHPSSIPADEVQAARDWFNAKRVVFAA